ncbi:MAG: DNA-binding protein [Parabacteroides sp.]
MIDYSVYMQKNHLKPEAGERAYARNQIREIWDGDRFVQHLSDHNGVFSRGTIKGVVSDVCNCIVEQVLNGNKVYLGELGCFYASLNCESANDLKSFTAANIKAVNLVFAPGRDFENMISKATFNPVTSRALQAIALKAQKNQAESIDLTHLSKEDASSNPTPENPGEEDAGNEDSGYL